MFAAKTIAKASIKTWKAKDKLITEIRIHKMLTHPNIVKFIDCFEDESNMYILLEVCTNNSMMSMLRKRKTLTEPEAKFFLTQIIGGIMYMHEMGVIHRDLKLGNIFLDDNMTVKIGDFGLAAQLYSNTERKKTICGTPNYIAPEVLFEKETGHSFEVDVWSVGIILYAIIVGKPPFQSRDIDSIYQRIKENNYGFPEGSASKESKELITCLLNNDPNKRPKLNEILTFDFFKVSFPASINAVSLTQVPDLVNVNMKQSEINFINCKVASLIMPRPEHTSKNHSRTKAVLPESLSSTITREKYSMIMFQNENLNRLDDNSKFNLKTSKANDMIEQLDLVKRLPHSTSSTSKSAKASSQNKDCFVNFVPASTLVETEFKNNIVQVPNAIKSTKASCQRNPINLIKGCIAYFNEGTEINTLCPHVDPYHCLGVQFITKWIDYSNKYGIAYQILDGMVGVLFTDGSITQLDHQSELVDTITWSAAESKWVLHRITNQNELLPSQVKCARLVRTMYAYMQTNLRDSSGLSKCPSVNTNDGIICQKKMLFLVQYRRFDDIVMFQLSNGSFQFNFSDHTKIIIDANGNRISFVDSDRELHSCSPKNEIACCNEFRLKLTSQFIGITRGKLEKCLEALKEIT